MPTRTATFPPTTEKVPSLRKVARIEYTSRTAMKGQAMATATGMRRSWMGTALLYPDVVTRMKDRPAKATM